MIYWFSIKKNLVILGDTFFVGHVPIVESSVKGMINVTNKFINNNIQSVYQVMGL